MGNPRLKLLTLACATAGMLNVGFASAQTVDDVLDADEAMAQAQVAAQSQVNAIADQTDGLVQQYKVLQKQIEGLKVYNAQLELQIADQNQKLNQLEVSIDEATTMEVDITPLEEEMLVALRQFIELDLPFNVEERLTRVDRLEANLARSDLSTSEKFRQILDAYNIEADYGKNLETYTQVININGTDLDVNILRLGRVSLMYQTKDQAITGAWNPDTNQWETLDNSYRSAVANGLRIAKKQASIDILNFPVSAPQG